MQTKLINESQQKYTMPDTHNNKKQQQQQQQQRRS